MNESIIEKASQLLEDGYDGVIGLRKRWGHVGPFLFTNTDELKDLELEPRYPLAATVCRLQARWPEKRFGAVLRGCDERAFVKSPFTQPLIVLAAGSALRNAKRKLSPEQMCVLSSCPMSLTKVWSKGKLSTFPSLRLYPLNTFAMSTIV